MAPADPMDKSNPDDATHDTLGSRGLSFQPWRSRP
jgi:hypothetical protein